MTLASNSLELFMGANTAKSFPVHLAENSSGDHEALLEEAINVSGLSPSEYFAKAGISQLASSNGGICGFRLAGKIALYQNTNLAVVNERYLEPSLAPNASMFGRFMGTLEVGDPERERKRASVEAEIGTLRFFEGRDEQIRVLVRQELQRAANSRQNTANVALRLTTAVVSRIPGLLDFRTLPLEELLEHSEFSGAVSGFFETASQVISAGKSPEEDAKAGLLGFVQAVLHGNFSDLEKAPKSNLVLKFFSDRAFTRESIDELDPEAGAELATIIVATYDTTSLTFLWLLVFLAEDDQKLDEICEVARNTDNTEDRLAELDLFVLEAIRLAGSNPTALWRRVSREFKLEYDSNTILVPEGTQIWLDRRHANCDPETFPNPQKFDVANVRSLKDRKNTSVASIVSRGRYEINSFSMVNVHRNPRKCPGRLFSIRLISIVMDELFASFDIDTQDANSSFKLFSAMPQPSNPGRTKLTARRQSTKTLEALP